MTQKDSGRLTLKKLKAEIDDFRIEVVRRNRTSNILSIIFSAITAIATTALVFVTTLYWKTTEDQLRLMGKQLVLVNDQITLNEKAVAQTDTSLVYYKKAIRQQDTGLNIQLKSFNQQKDYYQKTTRPFVYCDSIWPVYHLTKYYSDTKVDLNLKLHNVGNQPANKVRVKYGLYYDDLYDFSPSVSLENDYSRLYPNEHINVISELQNIPISSFNKYPYLKIIINYTDLADINYYTVECIEISFDSTRTYGKALFADIWTDFN